MTFSSFHEMKRKSVATPSDIFSHAPRESNASPFNLIYFSFKRCCSFSESYVHANNKPKKRFSARVHQKIFATSKGFIFLWFLLRGFFAPILRTMIQQKMNIKLEIEKNVLWHIERSITGQLRSVFQSKSKFIKSFSHQSIAFSLSEP